MATDGTNNSSLVTAVADSSGNWTASGIDVSALRDGTITFNATATDAQSNTGSASSTSIKSTVTITTAPTVNLDNVHDVSASGTGQVDAVVSVVITDTINGTTNPQTATVAADGTWSVTGIDASNLIDGTITFTATASDASNNTASRNLTSSKDTVAPAVTLASVSTTINAATANNVTASGTGEVDATITLTISDGTSPEPLTETTQVAPDGNWVITGIDVMSLADGTLTFVATATDAVGNSTTAPQVTRTKDTVAPQLSISSVDDPINSTNETAVVVSGTSDESAVVSVHAGDGSTTIADQMVTVPAGGNWSVTLDVSTLKSGPLTFTATAKDDSQNSTTATQDATKVTVAIVSVTDPITLASQMHTSVSGTGEPGATISVSASDGNTTTAPMTTTVAADGTWAVSDIDVSGLADGQITFTADSSDANTFTDQATKIAAKATVSLTAETPNPINAANQTNVQLNGTGQVAATVTLHVSDANNGSIGDSTTTVAGDGTWSFSNIDVSDLVDGDITFQITATDAQSNSAQVLLTVSKDTTLNVAISPIAEAITAANEQSFTVSGTADTDTSQLTISASDGLNPTIEQTVSVSVGGTWTAMFDLRSLASGPITFTAMATDNAGNTNSATVQATKVTVAIQSVTDPITIANEHSTTISGTGEPDATMSVTANDGTHFTDPATTIIDANGTWSVNLDVSALGDGSITYTATSTDGQNLTGEATTTSTKTTVAIGSFTNPIDLASQHNVTISGTGEANASILVSLSDGPHTLTGTTTISAGGTWTVSEIDAGTLDDGPVTYTVTATDADTNFATVSASATKSTVTILSVTQPINLNNVSSASVSGTGQPLAVVTLTVTDSATGSVTPPDATVGADGNWSISNIDLGMLADGTLTFTAVASDGAHSAQASLTALKDTLAPAVAFTSVTDPIDGSNDTDVQAAGTGEVGAGISVTATDGTNTSTPVNTVVQNDGNWSVGGIDVSGFNDGTITFTVTATDGAGNTATDMTTATGSGLGAPLVVSPLSSQAWYTQVGDTVTINGTPGDDTFEFIAGAGWNTVIFNGNSQQFDTNALNFIFSGGGGHDVATLVGSSGNDVATLGLGGGTLSGAGFGVGVSGVATLSVNGGGGADTATLDDSALDDLLVAAGDQVSLSNTDSLSTTLAAFASVQATSSHGGNDTADVSSIDFTLEQVGDWIDG